MKKIWDDHDNAAKIRPDVVTIKATHKTTKEVKVYTLTKDNNWTMFTDIKKDDREKWEFREDVPEGYTLTSTHWNDAMYVISFTTSMKIQNMSISMYKRFGKMVTMEMI